MGFLDKAKKLAEQAQTKLDEVQSQVNQPGSAQAPPQGPITEYDKHGRPIPPQQTASPPHGDPLAPGSVPPPPAPGGPTPDPGGSGFLGPADTADSAHAAAGRPAPVTPGVPPTEPPSGPPAPVEGTSAPPPAMPGVRRPARTATTRATHPRS